MEAFAALRGPRSPTGSAIGSGSVSENGRELDVVVFGATGVTGRQVAAYLSGTDSRWGAAGRDAAKLERTLADVGAAPTAALAADLADPGSLAAMAERAAVVLNLVGPYTNRARPVIEACVAAGAHYADLTGEIPFVREVVDEFDARARDAGIKLVQVCGFEALPPDLGVRLAAETARDRWGEELAEADVSVGTKGLPGIPRANDMISGGTFQSMAEMVGHPDPACLTDPAALIDDPATAQAVRAHSPITLRPRTDVRGAVVGPMAPTPFINPAVIHRSAELDARERGVTLPLRYGAAGALAGVQTGMRAMIRARPVVRERIATGMRKALPSSGFGPQADRLESWKWRMDVDARTTGSHELRVRTEADGHPGYLTTARMLGEAGLMLADDEVVPRRAGCLTPATALEALQVRGAAQPE